MAVARLGDAPRAPLAEDLAHQPVEADRLAPEDAIGVHDRRLLDDDPPPRPEVELVAGRFLVGRRCHLSQHHAVDEAHRLAPSFSDIIGSLFDQRPVNR